MEAIQRWEADPDDLTLLNPGEEPFYTEFVTFTDHERVVAEKDARIKELEGQVETGYRAGVNAATGRVLGAVKETLDRHGAPPFAQSLDIEPAYSTLYRLVLAALTDSGANNE